MLGKFPYLLNDIGKMHDLLWLYFYMAVINEANRKKNEILEVINSLLPWLNFGLWQKTKEQEEDVRKNVAYEQQVTEAMKGNYNKPIDLDELVAGNSVDASQYIQQNFDQGQPRSQQRFGRIKDVLFPNQD